MKIIFNFLTELSENKFVTICKVFMHVPTAIKITEKPINKISMPLNTIKFLSMLLCIFFDAF